MAQIQVTDLTLKKYCKEKGLDESLFLAVLRQLDLGREQFVKD